MKQMSQNDIDFLSNMLFTMYDESFCEYEKLLLYWWEKIFLKEEKNTYHLDQRLARNKTYNDRLLITMSSFYFVFNSWKRWFNLSRQNVIDLVKINWDQHYLQDCIRDIHHKQVIRDNECRNVKDKNGNHCFTIHHHDCINDWWNDICNIKEFKEDIEILMRFINNIDIRRDQIKRINPALRLQISKSIITKSFNMIKHDLESSLPNSKTWGYQIKRSKIHKFIKGSFYEKEYPNFDENEIKTLKKALHIN